jgi:hypothetical protein
MTQSQQSLHGNNSTTTPKNTHKDPCLPYKTKTKAHKMVYKAYKTELELNNKQRTFCRKHAGCARFAYNWGLQRKIVEYAKTGKSPSAYDLHRELNRLKKQNFHGCTKCLSALPKRHYGTSIKHSVISLEGYERVRSQVFQSLSRGNKASDPSG